MHIESLLRDAASQLNSISETPALDAELLLMHLLNVPRSYLYMHAEQAVDDSLKCQYHMLIQKRKTGFPVAYLLGKKSFWSLDLTVTEDTLIPRPETELIFELVLKKKFTKNDLKKLDLVNGS
ncbi:MAG: protein-(glutamine-N5) methyltransferase, release factor-specific, partial [Gammaproteobacteria bacterium]